MIDVDFEFEAGGLRVTEPSPFITYTFENDDRRRRSQNTRKCRVTHHVRLSLGKDSVDPKDPEFEDNLKKFRADMDMREKENKYTEDDLRRQFSQL